MRSSRRSSRPGSCWWLGCSLALLLIVAGCDPPSEPPPPNGTATITVVGSNGAPVGGAVVSVPEEGAAALADAEGEVTLVVTAGLQTFTVHLIGCPPVSIELDVPLGGNITSTVTLGCGDAVNDPTTTAPRTWLLAVGSDASGAATCGWEAPFVAAGLHPLGFNATAIDAGSAPCDLVAFVMAADVAPTYTNVTADLPWTAGSADLFAPVMPTAKLDVPMRIVVSDPSMSTGNRGDLELVLKDDIAFALSAFDASHSGIRLVDPAGGTPQYTFHNTTAVSTLLAGGCLNAAAIRATPAIYERGRLNVYYVATVTNENDSPKAGYSCQSSGAPEIVFVEWNGHFIATLAHEIGHALGLLVPFWGHTTYFAGFYTDAGGREHNVMADAVAEDISPPNDERYFSVGQVLRMYLGEASWLNFPSASDNSTLRQRSAMPAASTVVACGCPESATTASCPAVNADIDRSGVFAKLREPGALTFTCGVSSSAATATVCRGQVVTLSATLVPGADPQIAGTLWISRDLAIATVTPVWADPPTSTFSATVTGVLAGSTVIRAYADGAYAEFALTVLPPPC